MAQVRFQNQGQGIVAGWDNVPLLKDITAYVGSDGQVFLPVNDRNGYSPGRNVPLSTGGTKNSAMPTVIFTSPAITDGQIYTLVNTINGGQESNNVTVKYHRWDSVGRLNTFNANAVLNLHLEQLKNLTRRQTAYLNFQWELVITETL